MLMHLRDVVGRAGSVIAPGLRRASASACARAADVEGRRGKLENGVTVLVRAPGRVHRLRAVQLPGTRMLRRTVPCSRLGRGRRISVGKHGIRVFPVTGKPQTPAAPRPRRISRAALLAER